MTDQSVIGQPVIGEPAAAPTLAQQGLSQQGYFELSPAEMDRLRWAFRFTPAVMLALAAAGLITRSPALHAGLAGLGLLTFLLPAHHPIDLLYNHAVRHLAGAPALPPNPLPRRVAALVAAGLNLAICLLFTSGRPGAAYAVGAVLVALLLLLVTSQLCAVSGLLEALAKRRNRPAHLLTGDEARRLIDDGALLVDVRSPREFSRGHLPGAVNVPIDDLDRYLGGLVAERRPMVLYCAAGVRCNKAAVRLREAGAEEIHQLGTLARWES